MGLDIGRVHENVLKRELEKRKVDSIEDLEVKAVREVMQAQAQEAAQEIVKHVLSQSDENIAKAVAEVIEGMNAKFDESTKQLAKIATAQAKAINTKEAKREQLHELVKSTCAGIRDAMKDKTGEKTYTVDKAVTVTGSLANNTLADEIQEIGQLAYRKQGFLDYLAANGRFRVVPMGANGTVRYRDWDDATKVRAAAMIAEVGTFPESTAAWDTYTLKIKKVGDTIPWSDEFEYDDNFLMNELAQFLMVNIKIIKGGQVVNGDGTGNNITGVFSYAPTYTAVAAGLVDASIYDLYVKLREAIEAETGGKYQTDIALMNIVDINKYKLKKDANNNYIMPPFYDAEGNRIDGVTVIEDNNVTANTMWLGDSRYITVHTAEGLVTERGWINDDFNKGQSRMRMYERMGLLIRTVDRDGFLKVASISAALTTLEL